MNKLLVGIVTLIILIVTFLSFNNSSEEIKNPLQNDSKVPQYEKSKIINKEKNNNKVERNNVKTEKTAKNNIKNDTENCKNNFNQNIVKNKITEIHKNNKNRYKDELVFDGKKFNDFVDKNNLEEITSVNENIKIYAKNLPVRNDFTPPMPPVLIRVKFNKKTEVVPLNSNLLNSNKKIYIANKNQNDKKIEVKEINIKDISSFMPPTIGQN
jgi:hypothetical protein